MTLRKVNCPDPSCLFRYAVHISLVDPESWEA
jgi:hypothetical protein